MACIKFIYLRKIKKTNCIVCTDVLGEDELDVFNEVHVEENTKQKHDEFVSNANLLREKHHDLKDSYDTLERKTANGPSSQDFSESKVQHLWEEAQKSNLSANELSSLKVRA